MPRCKIPRNWSSQLKEGSQGIWGNKASWERTSKKNRQQVRPARHFSYSVIDYGINWSIFNMLIKEKMLSNGWVKNKRLGFPGGAVVESLPANAGDTGSSPGLGRSHMPRSSWARGLQLLSLRVWSLCSTTRETAIVRGPCTAMKSGPCLPQPEKALTQKWRPNTAINK